MNCELNIILLILIILFYFNIINIKLLKKYPIICLFLMLNIIVIYYNRDIGYVLLLILIFNITNIKKNQIGGDSNFFKKAATSLIPALGLVEEFSNYINNTVGDITNNNDTNTDTSNNNNTDTNTDTNTNTDTDTDNNNNSDNIIGGDDSSTEDSSDDSDTEDDDVFGDFDYEAYKDYL